MIGREAELDRLLRLLDDEARLVLIAGDPGVGKTMLVEEFVARLDPSIEVVRAYATPSSVDRPHDVLRSATADRVSAWSEVPAPLAGRTAAVVHLVGPVAPKLTGSGVAGPDEVAWVGAELLHHVAGDAPLVLVVDDLQWADAESLDIIDRLLMHERRSLVVTTHRPGALGHNSHVGAWISRMDRRQPVAHLRVAPLDLAATSALMGDLAGREPDPRAARNLWSRTGGNPFFISELVRCEPDVVSATFENVTLPVNVAAMVHDQLSVLDQPTRCTLDYVAVLGQEVRFEELLAVAGETESELSKQVQNLIDANLILEVGDDRFAFRHALLRDAVHDSVMSRQRRQMHSDALAWVLDNDGPPALVLHHALGAGRHDLIVDAARTAAIEAFESGSSFRALMLAETGLDEAPDDPDLLRVAARSSWHIGQQREARAHAVTLLDVAESQYFQADALRLLIRLDWEEKSPLNLDRDIAVGSQAAATHQSPVDYRAALIALLDQLDDADRAMALADLAQRSMLSCELHEAIRLAEEAIAIGERIGHRRVVAQAMVERASALSMLPDHLGEAAVAMDDALEACRQVGDWIAFCRGVNNIVHSTAAMSAEREDELVVEMRQVIQRLGAPELLCIKQEFIDMRVALRMGNLDELLTSVGGQTADRSRWLKLRALFLLEAGEFDEVLEKTDPAVHHENHAAMLRAVALGLMGKKDEAQKILTELFDAPPPVPVLDSDYYGDHVVGALMWFAPFLEGVGLDQSGLRATIAELQDDLQFPYIIGHVEGWLARQDGRFADAVPHYRAAIEAHTLGGHREGAADRASVHCDLARCLIELGQLAEARAELEIAEELLQNWGLWRRRQVAELLASISDPDADSDAHVDADAHDDPDLTPREAEVAALVAEGLSNGEIGERLYIARKTVSVHVSNMLAKLGLANRTELAAWVVRRHEGNRAGSADVSS